MISVMGVIVFWPTTKTYFSQDDWVFLFYVYKRSFFDVFTYHSESIYRPIGQQLFFWLGSIFFGLNSLGYHLVGLGIHTLNIFLLFRLLIICSKKSNLSMIFFLLAIYGLNPLHFVALNWLTQIDLEIAVSFSLGSLLIYRKRKFIALLLFALGMLSHEITAILPVAMAMLYGLNLWIGIMLGLAGIIGIGKYLINPFPLTQDYSIGLEPWALFNTIKWYLLRSLMVPEGVKGLPGFLKYLSSIPVILIMLVFRLRLTRGLMLFVVALTPVLLLSKHSMAAYAVLALALMVIILARDSKKLLINKYALILFSLLIGITFFFTIEDIHDKHWSTERGIISRRIGQEYMISNGEGRKKIQEASVDYTNNQEIYFATMMGKQLEVMSR